MGCWVLKFMGQWYISSNVFDKGRGDAMQGLFKGNYIEFYPHTVTVDVPAAGFHFRWSNQNDDEGLDSRFRGNDGGFYAAG